MKKRIFKTVKDFFEKPEPKLGGYTSDPPEHCEKQVKAYKKYWVDNVICAFYCDHETCERKGK